MVSFIRNDVESEIIYESGYTQGDDLEHDDISCITSLPEANNNATSDVIVHQPLRTTIIENIDQVTVADRTVEFMNDTSSCVTVEFKGAAEK